MRDSLLGLLVLTLMVGCDPGGHTSDGDGGAPGRDGGHEVRDASAADVDATLSMDASTPGDGGPSQPPDAGTEPDPSTPDAGTEPEPEPCRTRITYGSAWIHGAGHAAMYDDTSGRVTWDGVCQWDGQSSYAVLSNGWKPYFAGRSSCVIALDVRGECEDPPPAECRTRVTYGESWNAPGGHPNRYDDVRGVVTWNGECEDAGASSRGLLSNGWTPYFAGSDACWMGFRYEQCGGLFVNPVVDQSCADPGVVHDGSRYVMVCTSGSAATAFRMRTSTDLVHWQVEEGRAVFPSGTWPSWASGDFWAPEIHAVGSGWVAYFSARRSDGRLVVGAATADDVLGPYTDIGQPLIVGTGPGVIDAHHFEDTDGQHYVVWKVDGNQNGGPTPILIQRLESDGVTLEGEAATMIDHDLDWEGSLVEGPWLIREGDYYYLFYSANGYASTRYAVGVARRPVSDGVMGEFTKLEDPILTSNDAWSGPGHGSVVRDPNGDWVFVYHSWVAGHVTDSPGRLVLVDRITWRDGWPHMHSAPSTRSQPPP